MSDKHIGIFNFSNLLQELVLKKEIRSDENFSIRYMYINIKVIVIMVFFMRIGNAYRRFFLQQYQYIKYLQLKPLHNSFSSLKLLNEPVTKLNGVGPKTGEQLAKLGIYNVNDLLLYLPSIVQDTTKRSSLHEIKDNTPISIELEVEQIMDKFQYSNNRNAPNKVICRDIEENVSITLTYFFRGKSAYADIQWNKLTDLLSKHKRIYVSGKLSRSNYDKSLEIINPDEVLPALPEYKEKIFKLQPIYGLTEGLSGSKLKQTLKIALEYMNTKYSASYQEWIEPRILEDRKWASFHEALFSLHQPEALSKNILDDPHRQRLAFDELLHLQLRLKDKMEI